MRRVAGRKPMLHLWRSRYPSGVEQLHMRFLLPDLYLGAQRSADENVN